MIEFLRFSRRGGLQVAYTKFGELMRILRIKHHEVMGDMAKVLKVSVPFLSAVENGKKNVPTNWINLLAIHYKLSEQEVEELSDAANFSKTQIKIDLRNAENTQREVALQLARSFDDLDEATAQKIAELLKGRLKNNGLSDETDES